MTAFASPEEETFPLASRRRPITDDPSRHDARIVQHESVAGTKQAWQVANRVMLDRLPGTIQDEQPRTIPLFRRLFRNEFFGKLVRVGIEVVDPRRGGRHSQQTFGLWFFNLDEGRKTFNRRKQRTRSNTNSVSFALSC
jgi:hypothetical protein